MGVISLARVGQQLATFIGKCNVHVNAMVARAAVSVSQLRSSVSQLRSLEVLSSGAVEHVERTKG